MQSRQQKRRRNSFSATCLSQTQRWKLNLDISTLDIIECRSSPATRRLQTRSGNRLDWLLRCCVGLHNFQRLFLRRRILLRNQTFWFTTRRLCSQTSWDVCAFIASEVEVALHSASVRKKKTWEKALGERGKQLWGNTRRFRGSKMSSAPGSTTWLFPGWLIILCGWPHRGCSPEAADEKKTGNFFFLCISLHVDEECATTEEAQRFTRLFHSCRSDLRLWRNHWWKQLIQLTSTYYIWVHLHAFMWPETDPTGAFFTLKGNATNFTHGIVFTGLVEYCFHMWKKAEWSLVWLQRKLHVIWWISSGDATLWPVALWVM